MGGKTRLQMRTDLKTDLRTTDEITDAELNRAIERSVADLSRFLPREKTYEESLQFTVADEEVTMPSDTSTDGVVADEELKDVSDGSAVGIDSQPDVPRPLTITITDPNNSLTGMTVTAYGIDEDELAVKETFHWHRGDGKTIPGKKYFKNVYMVYVDQIDGNAAGDILDIGWGTYTDVWVSLAYKPVKWGSEKDVTDTDDNAITRNTDFYIDYMKGRIKAISSGDIVASDTVTISYTKGQLWLDISALADFIRVDRVEYPVGQIPQTLVQHDVWGDIVTITGGSEQEEQGSMAEDKHIRVYYSAEHQSPTDYSPGSVPEFLENTILMAAGAYALFTYAAKQELAAETAIGSAGTQLSAANSAHTLLSTALTNIKKYLDNNSNADAKTSLASANTDHSAFATALTNLKTYLDDNGTDDAISSLGSANGDHSAFAIALTNLKKYLDDNTTNDAESSLGSANGDHSAFGTALTSLKQYLDNNNTTDAAGLLDDINNDTEAIKVAIAAALDAANAYLDLVANDITVANAVRAKYIETVNYVDGGTEPDIKTYLASGDALLNTVAVGGESTEVMEAYRRYAETVSAALVGAFERDRAFYIQNATARTNAALAYVQESAQRLSELRSYVERSAGYATISSLFAREAETRVASINTYLRQAEGYVAVSGMFGVEAEARVAAINAYLVQSQGYVAVANAFAREAEARALGIGAYLRQAEGYATVAATFAREAEGRIATINAYIAEAAQYVQTAGGYMALADRFKADAIERRNEVYSIWRDRKQYIGDYVQSSMKQLPSYNSR